MNNVKRKKDKITLIRNDSHPSMIVNNIGRLTVLFLTTAVAMSALRNHSDKTKELGIVFWDSESRTIFFLSCFIVVLVLLFACLEIKKAGVRKVQPPLYILFAHIKNIAAWILTPVAAFWFVQWTAVYKKYAMLVLPEYWVKNLIIYYVFLLILTILLRHFRAAESLFLGGMLLLSLVFYFVYEFRGREVSIVDLYGISTAADVAGGYKLQFDGALGRTILLYLAISVILVNLQNAEWTKSMSALSGRLIAFIAVAGGCFIFIISGKAVSQYLITEEDFWALNVTYREKGVAYTLMGQIKYLNFEKPKGYSPAKAEEIVKEAEKDYEDNILNSTGSSVMTPLVEDSQKPLNLIVIMNESFADMDILGEVKTDTPLIKEWKELCENYSSGNLHVQIFGGGTSDTEYEFLTGNAKPFFPKNSIIYELFCREPEYGMAMLLKEQGYTTVGIHPSKEKNWNRKKVYLEMGFDETIFREDWDKSYEDKIHGFISDEAMYRLIVEQYEKKKPGEKLFTFGVTIQNHGGYDNFEEHDDKPEVELQYDSDYSDAAYYLTLLNRSSTALQYLIDSFENCDEPTMIVMFGDHQANIPGSFYNDVMGQNVETLDNVAVNKRYVVPYMIWTNYEMPREVDEMSSNYFGCYVMERAGLSLSSYQKYLLTLKKQLPVLGINDTFQDSAGNWYTAETLPEKLSSKLKEYQTVQYNRTADRGHVVEELFTVELNK